MAREQLGIQEEGLIERREENLVAEAQVRQHVMSCYCKSLGQCLGDVACVGFKGQP